MQPLAQPPRKDDSSFDDWMYRLWRRVSATAGIAWSMVDKTGSNLTDLTTRNHNDLQNIQGGADLQHLTAAQVLSLTTVNKWPVVSDTIDVGETVTIPANRQLLIAQKLTNSGTLTNNGRLVIL